LQNKTIETTLFNSMWERGNLSFKYPEPLASPALPIKHPVVTVQSHAPQPPSSFNINTVAPIVIGGMASLYICNSLYRCGRYWFFNKKGKEPSSVALTTIAIDKSTLNQTDRGVIRKRA
jgi:hypothetical protein